VAQNPEYAGTGVEWERAIRIDERDNCFYFTVESTGALQPEDIVIGAFNVLRQKLSMLKDSINF
jgi:RNA polymerase Rpb3/Rpb11 dimerisation domain